MNKIEQELILDKIIKDQTLRREITRRSHFWFFYTYFSHYINCQIAPFHKEMFELTEDESVKTVVMVAFRGSAKSTIMNMSFPIWSILGVQKKKYILILGQTQQQARQHLKNLKDELEQNTLLKEDLGPFEEQEDEWNAYSIVLPKYGARITAASTEQSLRGTRHKSHRPDLIICDDIEDLASVKTREGRDKTYTWLTSEVIPAGDKNTRLIVIGNLLHDDSLIMRMKNNIIGGYLSGVFKEYPLVDENGKCTWPGKYPTAKHIEAEKLRIGSESAWQREYMLNIIDDRDQVIQKKWICHYEELPPEIKSSHFRFTAIGIDPAISLREHADYTAMVVAKVFGYGEDMRVYILPNPVYERLTHLETIDRAKSISKVYEGDGGKAQLYVEDVAYQHALIEHLKKQGCYVKGIKVGGLDKRARLANASYLVQKSQVLFPSQGAERLIQQITHFGLEKHDDLADAFSMLISVIAEEYSHGGDVSLFYGGEPRRGPMEGPATFGNIWERQF